MHDLVIRGGTIVDGTGNPRFVGDIAVDGDRIVAVGEVPGKGRREVDARGLLVTPGWVDMHTHYDGQVTWDPYFTPSGWHGCTTVVMGNCGVGFAPCRASEREWLINVMEGVEDIPGSALTEGIQWSWETFPEYMDAIEAVPHAIDFATQIPHSALRAWVMGMRESENDKATPAQIAEMAGLVEEAIQAGALGFSTSRTSLHKSAEGVLVSGTFADPDELYGIAGAIQNAGFGVFELAPDHLMVPTDLPMMRKIAEITGNPVVFNLSQTDFSPETWRKGLQGLEAAAADGLPLYAQCAGRAIGVQMNWRLTAHPFVAYPSMEAISTLPWDQQLAKLRDPAFRAQLLSEKPRELNVFERFVTESFDKMYPLVDALYEPDPSQSIAAIAKREGRDPLDVAYDQMLENDGQGMLYFPLFNYSDKSYDLLHELHQHERTRMGLSDGGAHCGAVCDGGMPTYMLTFWTRDRARGEKLGLEHIVKRQTSETAQFYGMHDRGILKPGYKADINVLDYEGLKLSQPEIAYDLPAGGRRLIQKAEGYVMTVCSGTVVAENGEMTGAMPGRLVRGRQAGPDAGVALPKLASGPELRA
ncbi:MAG: amidohydrolase family protein [Alphaproteobacteria bacterium]|nr:amidohydrolase family protein [Alphaproteobacteria bacterium]